MSPRTPFSLPYMASQDRLQWPQAELGEHGSRSVCSTSGQGEKSPLPRDLRGGAPASGWDGPDTDQHAGPPRPSPPPAGLVLFWGPFISFRFWGHLPPVVLGALESQTWSAVSVSRLCAQCWAENLARRRFQ